MADPHQPLRPLRGHPDMRAMDDSNRGFISGFSPILKFNAYAFDSGDTSALKVNGSFQLEIPRSV